MGTNLSVSSAEANLKMAESRLLSAKNAKKQAQDNGNYKRASKNITADGKTMNCYDYDIHRYQKHVKECKEQLAAAKKAAK